MNTNTKSLILLVALVQISCSVLGQSKAIKELDKYYEKYREAYNVPGLGVALVQDGRIVFEKGYGVRSTATQVPVDANTNFAIASNSKAYTATLLAMLVEEGKLNWDDPVRKHLPWFELYDPYVSDKMTVRDLLCHRSGLATFSGDLLWYGSTHSAREVVEKARQLEPVFDFRAGYGYQNIMFIAAGLVIEEITGKSWQEEVRDRILKPLGMDGTLVSTTEINENVNLASPHNDVKGTNKVIDWVNWDNVAAAGALISSAHDCASWLKFNIDQGIVGNDTLLSANMMQTLWEIQTPIPTSPWSRNFWQGRTLQGYGLGWQVMVYKGKRVIHHGGGYDGMISHTFFMPEDGIGGAFLTNNITSLSTTLMYETIDRLLGEKEQMDWSGKLLKLMDQFHEQDAAALAAFEGARNLNAPLSHPIQEYIGTYRDEMYGDVRLFIEINEEDQDSFNEISFQFEPTPLFHGTLTHWHYDTFRLSWGEQMMLPQGIARFVLDEQGQITELHIDVPNPDFDFTELKFTKVVE